MKISINSQVLAAELRTLVKIVPSKPAIQILGCVLLSARDGLTLSATNLEVACSYSAPARITEHGIAALPAEKFLQMIEQFSDSDVHLSSMGGAVTIRCGQFASKFQAFPADEFPPMPVMPAETRTVPAEALRRLIAATRYAVAERSQKYVLEGALLKFSGESIGMVATDSKRLAIATASGTAGQDCQVVVPRKTMDALTELLGADVELAIGSQHLFFKQGDKVIASRMIDGKFPAYERVVPVGNEHIATVNRQQLGAALRRVAVASEFNQAAYFAFGKQLMLSTRSAEVGEADEVLPVGYNGPEMKICANWRYVLDFLEAAEGIDITVALKNEKSSMLFSDGPSFINVIMAMRTT